MKKLLLILLLCLPFIGFGQDDITAQCISGDCQNGYGTLIWSDGAKYIGEWKDGQILIGLYIWGDGGSKYVGKFNGNGFHGHGITFHIDGSKHIGEYKDDFEDGYGTHTSASSGDKYEGEYKRGRKHGKGTYTYGDGSKYIGEYKDDKMHGQGTYTYADGTIKKGLWKDDEFIE